MGTAVPIKEAVVVSPSAETPSRILPLSALDSQPFLRFTIEYLLVYAPSPAQDRALTLARLKSALARALVPYYPLSGRVRPGPDNKLEVACEAQGAVLIEAESGFTRADLDRAPHYVDERRDLLCLHVDDVLRGDPPLVLQLTWLADGAAALAIGFNHCLIDGIGTSHFLASLSALTRGDKQTMDTHPQPVWARHLLDPDPKKPAHPNPDSHPEFTRAPDISGFLARFSARPLVPTSSVFSRRRIKDLKRRASPGPGPGTDSPRTTFEVVSAHVWACWARSLRLPPNQVLKLLFSVNVRNRVDKPGLPTGYYGNGFVLGCVKATAKEVAEKGIGHVAALISKAKDRVDEAYIREVAELVGLTRACPDPVGVLVLSQWSRLELESVDFFGLGKAVNVGPVCCDRYCLLLPACDRRGAAVKVMVALPVTAADVYKDLLKKPPLC